MSFIEFEILPILLSANDLNYIHYTLSGTDPIWHCECDMKARKYHPS